VAKDDVSVRSVELHELLGAVMVALVRADALAAKATLEYIETVGFVPPRTERREEPGTTIASGRLRMASFRYRKRDENNELADFVAEVPVLSLVPIPALQVANATVSFAVKIDDITTMKDGEVPRPAPPTDGAPRLVPFLQATATRLIARPAASSGAKTEETRSTHHIEIDLTMDRADIPLGLEKIFNLMDQAIVDKKAPDR